MVQRRFHSKFYNHKPPFLLGFMWILVNVSDRLNQKKPNDLFRKLSKGESSISGISNKLFFKNNIFGGFWRYNLSGDKLDYSLFIKLKNPHKSRATIKHIKFRLRKMGKSNIIISEIDENKVIPLCYPKYFRAFGSYY